MYKMENYFDKREQCFAPFFAMSDQTLDIQF